VLGLLAQLFVMSAAKPHVVPSLFTLRVPACFDGGLFLRPQSLAYPSSFAVCSFVEEWR